MKAALITGASSGIGREFVRQIADSGAYDKIYVVARREYRLCELQKEFGERIVPICGDLGKAETFEVIDRQLSEDNVCLSLLVAAAGFGKFGSFAHNSQADMEAIVEVNILGLMRTVRCALRHMEAHSRIILMGSQSAFQPLPEFNVYASSKAFVLHFGRALNAELANRGITVTTVCPGYVATEFIEIAEKSGDPNACRNFRPLYQPRDVVRKALWDSRKGRDVSVYGWTIQSARLLAKILPHKWVMQVWLKIR